MLALRGSRPGFRVAVLTTVAAATLLVVPATASADLGIGIDPVKDVVDQTTDLVVDTTTQTLDLVEDTVTPESLPTLGQVVTDVTTQVAQTTQQLAGGATGPQGSSGGSGGASDPEPQAATPSAKSSSTTPARKSGAAASTQAVRTTSGVHGSGVASVSAGARSSRFTTAHAPPPPRSRASGPGGLAATGWDVAVPLALLALLVTVGLSARAAERRRSGVARGEWRYRGRHRVPSRWRPVLSPVPA